MALGAVLALIIFAAILVSGAAAEPASEPTLPAAAQLDAGGQHTCSLEAGTVRCWGLGFSGQLGYANTNTIGDDEVPGAAGRVDLGPGRTATAISAGDFHTCAILDNGSVRCWGFGRDGRLGYGNENDIGDNETPGSIAPVNIGTGRTAVAISAGGGHTCAVLNTGDVLCWGFGDDGRLGYGDQESIGDNEQPGLLAPVFLGANRTAVAVTAGSQHTCALLDNQTVRCWGTNGPRFGGDGRLGYGNAATIGDNETPGSLADPVQLGAGAVAISAGAFHTCAVLVGGAVRCWGDGTDGRNGYANEFLIGDNETPASVGPVALGASATAISVGNHSCARLTGGAVRCWGPGAGGRLGYGNTTDIGDNETPASVAPVAVGGSARAISAGSEHTCARLEDTTLRCWGLGTFGRLGYANLNTIGDDETPATTGAVQFKPSLSVVGDAVVNEGNAGATTAVTLTVTLSYAAQEAVTVAYATADDSATAPSDYTASSGTLTFAPGDTTKTVTVQINGDDADEPDERLFLNLANPTNAVLGDAQASITIIDDDEPAGVTPPLPPPPPPPGPGGSGTPPAVDGLDEALSAQAKRVTDLKKCRTSSTTKMRTARTAARRRLRGAAMARALRRINADAAKRRRACDKRFGRSPGRVSSLVARGSSRTTVVLSFEAVGTDGSKPPAARGYLVKQSPRPIRTVREFQRASALCRGNCRVDVTAPGSQIELRVTGLSPGKRYYYAIAARDNVSARLGPRSKTASVTTRK